MGVTPQIEHRPAATAAGPATPRLIHLDTEKIRSLGWAPTLNIRDAIARTLEWFEAEPGIVLDQETTPS